MFLTWEYHSWKVGTGFKETTTHYFKCTFVSYAFFKYKFQNVRNDNRYVEEGKEVEVT